MGAWLCLVNNMALMVPKDVQGCCSLPFLVFYRLNLSALANGWRPFSVVFIVEHAWRICTYGGKRSCSSGYIPAWMPPDQWNAQGLKSVCVVHHLMQIEYHSAGADDGISRRRRGRADAAELAPIMPLAAPED